VSLLCRVFDFLVTQAMGAGGMRIVTLYQLAPRSKLLLMAFVNPKAETSMYLRRLDASDQILAWRGL
jgi:hypothetical protein